MIPNHDVREALWQAFLAGWEESGEGWNSEYPYYDVRPKLRAAFDRKFPAPATDSGPDV